MTSNEEELWHKVCENCGIEKSVTTQWLNKIREKYDNESERVYHNSQILRSKCEHIVEVDEAGDIALADALVFAIFFQYYFFDVKSDCGDRNREAFRSFCAEANVTDVSLLRIYEIQTMRVAIELSNFSLFSISIASKGKTRSDRVTIARRPEYKCRWY